MSLSCLLISIVFEMLFVSAIGKHKVGSVLSPMLLRTSRNSLVQGNALLSKRYCHVPECLSGGANVLSIFKRLGWTIGEVPDRYIAYDAGQDKIVGRCAAGHDVANSNFSLLPPHFTPPDFEIGFELGRDHPWI